MISNFYVLKAWLCNATYDRLLTKRENVLKGLEWLHRKEEWKRKEEKTDETQSTIFPLCALISPGIIVYIY